MAPVALDTVILGVDPGEVHAGEEIPAVWKDLAGNENETDFARLEELGYIEPTGAEATVEQLRERAAELELEVPKRISRDKLATLVEEAEALAAAGTGEGEPTGAEGGDPPVES